jgi:hypothetical protein
MYAGITQSQYFLIKSPTKNKPQAHTELELLHTRIIDSPMAQVVCTMLGLKLATSLNQAQKVLNAALSFLSLSLFPGRCYTALAGVRDSAPHAAQLVGRYPGKAQ